MSCVSRNARLFCWQRAFGTLTMFLRCSRSVEMEHFGSLEPCTRADLKTLIFLGNSAVPGTILWSDFVAAGEQVSLDCLGDRESELDFDDPVNIQYTSGTTGFPKGATLSHYKIVNNGLLIANAMRFTHNDRLCIPVPFYHCFGMVLANMACVVSGATMVVRHPR